MVVPGQVVALEIQKVQDPGLFHCYLAFISETSNGVQP